MLFVFLWILCSPVTQLFAALFLIRLFVFAPLLRMAFGVSFRGLARAFPRFLGLAKLLVLAIPLVRSLPRRFLALRSVRFLYPFAYLFPVAAIRLPLPFQIFFWMGKTPAFFSFAFPVFVGNAPLRGPVAGFAPPLFTGLSHEFPIETHVARNFKMWE